LATACGATRHAEGNGTTTTGPGTSTTTAPTSTTTTPLPPTTTVPSTTTTTVPSTTTTTEATTTTTAGPATASDWAALGAKLSGRLSLPSTPGYPLDMELYDPRYDAIKPAAVSFCANADDVARCITFARDHALAMTARSGGHSYGGYSTTSGMVIDVSLMDRTVYNGKTATVGAGARLIDVYSGLAAQGVSIPGGSCPTVGIAGLALGGGIGVVDRLHGLTCDSISSLQVVTADGQVVTADASTNPDLYWACRGGGGGNFGVVTAFEFAPFGVVDLALFGASWPWEAADQLLPAWLQWASSAPDQLWSNCVLEADPGAATPRVYVGGVYAGGQVDANAQLAKLVSAVGQPSGQALGENSYADAMYIEAGCRGISQAACHLAGKYPGGTLARSVSVAKSDVLNTPLGDAGVRAVLAGIEQRQSQGGPGGVALDAWGGAINRVASDATAFVHRKAMASAQYVADFGPYGSAADVSSTQAWMGSWYASLRPFVSGEAYQNYIDPSLANWQQAYYGANLARLREVKAKWDPDDVWHFAQSIPLPAD
jgi:FAD binding domain/Berberine and berberine like